jgi:protein-disulfide isomerase/uncharacterized membrane protein
MTTPDRRDDELRPGTWLVLTRAAVLLALVASAALYAQYLNPAQASFCGHGGGCEAVRRSGLGYFFGNRLLSVPLVGLVAYGTVLVVSVRSPRSRATLRLTAAGALIAVLLVAVQALYVHAFCWLCLVVDLSAVAAALFAGCDARGTGPELPGRRDPLRRAAWFALGSLAVATPLVWVRVKPQPPVPDVIRALYVPGKVNVVEFQDFECPFCRALYPILKRVLADYPPGEVHFVRKQVPLESHEEARPAARADVCAEEQGKGDALADKLVEIDLSASTIRRAALETGVDPERFDRCLASPDPDARIDADVATLKAAGMEGLPTTYIGGKRLLGLVSEAAVRDAMDRAARGEEERGVPGPIYLALAIALALAAGWLGRSSRATVLDG